MVDLMLSYIPTMLSLILVQPGRSQEGKPVLVGTLKHEAPAWGMRFSPDGRTLTTVVRPKNKVVQWNLKTMLQKTLPAARNEGWMRGEEYSLNGGILVTAGVLTKAPPAQSEDWVTIWDLDAGKENAAIRARQLSRPALSPDGKFLAVIKRDDPLNDHGTVILMDTKSGKQLPTLSNQPATAQGIDLYGVTFSSDSKTLAIEGWDHEKKLAEDKLWDVETRKVRATLTGSVGLMQVSFSPDSKTIATRSWDELSRDRERKLELKLWDAITGKEKAELKGHHAQILSIAFSPDGKVLATGGGTVHLSPITPKVVTGDLSLPVTEAELKLWDAATGKERANLGGHKNPVYVIEFSPDGRLLATASGFATKPGELRLWDVTTGKPLPAPDGFADGVTSLAFSPDNKVLAVGDGKGIVQLWNVSGVDRSPKP